MQISLTRFTQQLLLLMSAVFSCALVAEEIKPSQLPEPLTLEHALSLSQNNHPDNVLARARLDIAVADKNNAAGVSGFQTKLVGRLRWSESSSNNVNAEDHLIGLFASKRIYDFGLSKAKIDSAVANVDTYQWRVKDQQVQHRIAIMQAFFDVLLADLAYTRDNEQMAVAYVNFDRVKDRSALGQVADVEMLKAENAYYITRSVRYASDVKRRASRSSLANILNVPGQLPLNLIRPKLIMHKRMLPDIEQLQKMAVENNYNLNSFRQKVAAARHNVLSARALKKPFIDLQLQATEFTRATRLSDRFRVGIVFEVPLSSSGVVDAEIAKQRLLLLEAQAELRRAEMQVQQQVLELWQQVYIVKAQRDEALIFSEYRDLALDKSRSLYELDIKSDFGDSLAFSSAALYNEAKADFDLTLVWVKLDAILGKPVNFKIVATEMLTR